MIQYRHRSRLGAIIYSQKKIGGNEKGRHFCPTTTAPPQAGPVVTGPACGGAVVVLQIIDQFIVFMLSLSRIGVREEELFIFSHMC